MNQFATDIALPQNKDFRIFLQSDLARRCQKNPKYSLRSYAKFLAVSPSFLSHLLHGKRAVTRSTLDKFSKKIGLNPETTDAYVRYHFEKTSTEEATKISLNQLSMDQFQIISDWYHYAILELILLDGFQPSVKWVARVLMITVSEVHGAIERLQRVGLLTLLPNGKWIANPQGNTTIGNDFTTVALRSLQKQILEKSVVALETQPLTERDHTSVTMAMDSSLMPEAKLCIRKFRKQMIRLQEKSQLKDQVYHLAVSFYPLLKK